MNDKPLSPYYTDQEVREEIDKVLELNAKAWANTGLETPKEEKIRVGKECNARLISVLNKDAEFVHGLLEATDKYE